MLMTLEATSEEVAEVEVRAVEVSEEETLTQAITVAEIKGTDRRITPINLRAI